MKTRILLLLCVIAMMAIFFVACAPKSEHEHSVEHIDAKAATCSANGNVEYWHCTGCNEMWADKDLTTKVNAEGVLTAKTNHEYTYTCDAHCKNCYELTNLNFNHSVQHVKAAAPTCTKEGNIEYWYCTICGSAWTNEALTRPTNLKSVRLSTNHARLTHFDALDPGCHYDGNVEHWYCSECLTVFTDEALTQPSSFEDVIIPKIEE